MMDDHGVTIWRSEGFILVACFVIEKNCLGF